MEGKRPAQTSKGLAALVEQPPAVKPRQVADWVDTFVEYTSGFPSPEVFKKWGAIATIAMALERKVWLRTNIGELYPNLYIMVIAPPGVGKTIITSTVHDFISQLPSHHIAPSSVSRASLIDALMEAERKVIDHKAASPVKTFHSLAVIQNEMGVFLPMYDTEFMATLTDLYDGKQYHEKKRSKDINNTMANPQLNLFCATTVAYLHDTMPEQAWDHGFLSRTILIHSGEMTIRSLFDIIDAPELVKNQLIQDLKSIGSLMGRFKFEAAAASAIDAWHQAGGPPKPDHPKLQHYGTRRSAHILKLCMIASVSRSNDMIITLDDYHRALGWLFEAESFMPDIFKSMSIGGDAKAIEDTYYWAYKMYMKKGEALSEAALIEYLQNKVASHSVERILQLMVKSRLLEKTFDGYRPRAKKDN